MRDAATTLRAFADLGFLGEGRAYLDWLLHSTRLPRPRLMVMYDVHGGILPPLQELGHLEGYCGSAPVRITGDRRPDDHPGLGDLSLRSSAGHRWQSLPTRHP